ncbi:MAG TPA: tetratricopeptide repeat protein, partial [Phycisphaerae bacterium]|nr:tetratricopeptide repeat protein [Phycisphaerae bacterium]
ERPNPYSYEIMAVMTDRGEGIQASDEGALKQMLKAAQLGSTMAMRGVSLCYAQGSGIERDPKGAVEWAQKAIDRGNSKAMTAMGTYLHNGVGVKRDDEAAKQMFQHAVELGDEEAMGHMGELYLASAADAETALSWFQKGTEAGDPASMFYLGGMYAAGRPVNLDLTQAVNLYRRSSDMGYGPAMNAMGELIRFGRINGTMAEAIRWFRSSANAETPAGMRNLGEILAQQGLGDPLKNDDNDNAKLAESITWVTKAANAGDLLAMVDLGDANLTGVGVPSNGFAASVWYKRAADAGNIPATRKLGIMYSDGYYIAHDTAQADALLKKAAAAGDAPAMAALGTLYENGGGKIEKDLNTARQWYERAAELKDAGGYRGLAHLYQDVMNPPDLPRAVRYYEQAVALGDPKSMEFLARMLDIGQGVSKSPDNKARAISLMQQAYKLTGSTTARDWLQSRDLPLDPATQPRGNSREGRSGPMTNPAMPGRGR